MGLPECALPEDQVPQCWSDDVRMNALFAPFRLKTTNPESWDMKMKFWSDMTRQWCKFKKDPIISAADLKCAFQRKGRTAACVDIVVEEMYRNGDLCPVSKYQQILHAGPEGWVRWGARLAFTAVTALLPARHALDSDGLPKASVDATQRFVLESAVKEQATELLTTFPPGEDRVGSIEDLMISSGATDRDTFQILLGYLLAQGLAVKKGDVVKLAEPNHRVAAISAADEAVARSVCAERRLEADARRLQREQQSAVAAVRAALRLGDKRTAKNHLRRQHKLSSRLQQCEAALDNVRALAQSLRDASEQRSVLDTYRTSAEAMKSTMKEAGMEEDLVHDTMEDLKEVLDSYNEVEKALAGSIDDSDLADLDKELNDLLSGPGEGGSPAADNKTEARLPRPPEREFVFDGEEQMLAELNKLSVDDRAPAEAASAAPQAGQAERAKVWSAPHSEWGRGYEELRQDERLHPGQPLNVDFSTAARHYGDQFQVRDHARAAGVWLYSRDDSRNRGRSNENESGNENEKEKEEEKQKEQKEKENTETRGVEDLERRLNKLRGMQS